MSKLTEQNLLKKSRFLKYSFLASISVGVVMAMPFEGMASSVLSKSLEELEAHYKAIKEDDYIQRQRNRTKSFGKVGKDLLLEDERQQVVKQQDKIFMVLNRQSKRLKN